jgi:glutathione S-transferase
MATAKPQTTIPTLYNMAHSQSMRVHWALHEVLLANPSFKFNVKNYPRSRPSHKDLFVHDPLGKAPQLVLETVDGSPPPLIQVRPGDLTESRLIIEYINNNYAGGMWTPDSEEDKLRDTFFTEYARATVMMKVDFGTIFAVLPLVTPWPFSWLSHAVTYPLLTHFKSEYVDIYQILEDALSDEKPWFGGKKLGLSDLNLIFAMDTVKQKGWFDGTKFPKLQDWLERVHKREAYRAALAYEIKENGKYDLVKYGQ